MCRVKFSAAGCRAAEGVEVDKTAGVRCVGIPDGLAAIIIPCRVTAEQRISRIEGRVRSIDSVGERRNRSRRRYHGSRGAIVVRRSLGERGTADHQQNSRYRHEQALFARAIHFCSVHTKVPHLIAMVR